MGKKELDIAVTIIQLIGGGLLIALGITSFAMDRNVNYRWGIIYVYYIILGAFIALHQLKIGPMNQLFGFLNNPLGKSFFAFFLGMFTFYWWHWLQTLTFCYFFISCFLYLILVYFAGEEFTGASWGRSNEYGTTNQ